MSDVLTPEQVAAIAERAREIVASETKPGGWRTGAVHFCALDVPALLASHAALAGENTRLRRALEALTADADRLAASLQTARAEECDTLRAECRDWRHLVAQDKRVLDIVRQERDTVQAETARLTAALEMLVHWGGMSDGRGNADDQAASGAISAAAFEKRYGSMELSDLQAHIHAALAGGDGTEG